MKMPIAIVLFAVLLSICFAQYRNCQDTDKLALDQPKSGRSKGDEHPFKYGLYATLIDDTPAIKGGVGSERYLYYLFTQEGIVNRFSGAMTKNMPLDCSPLFNRGDWGVFSFAAVGLGGSITLWHPTIKDENGLFPIDSKQRYVEKHLDLSGRIVEGVLTLDEKTELGENTLEYLYVGPYSANGLKVENAAHIRAFKGIGVVDRERLIKE